MNEITYELFRDWTMVDRPAFMANLALAETVRGVPGTIVECGVWRGGMMAGIAATLGPSRSYLLFDSFQGLPVARPIDGEAAMRWQADVTSKAWRNNCAAPKGDAEYAMQMAGAERFEIVEGWFAETLPAYRWQEGIVLLRLDADWYEATHCCLDHLFDRVEPGGLIIVDDYYVWDGCSRAVHDFLSARKARERIRERDGVCTLIKEGV